MSFKIIDDKTMKLPIYNDEHKQSKSNLNKGEEESKKPKMKEKFNKII